MGLFDEFRKKPGETNEIGNEELKETIVNAALALLKQDEDGGSTAYTRGKFGYLFTIRRHGVEALFRVTDDAGASAEYFAVQGEQLLRLDFTEELFEQTTAEFLSRHG